jgi:hypothetical protein
MCPTTSKLAVLSAAALFALSPVAWCASNSSANTDQQNASQNQSDSKSPDKSMSQADQSRPGWVLVDENFVMLTANEPQNHFLQADQDLSQHDTKAAAAEIRLAAEYMQMQASRSQGADKQQLDKAANEVRQCASEVYKANGKQTSDLKQTFGKADLALAQYFQMKSESELSANKTVIAGYDLQGAANSLQAAYAWTGKQLPDKAAAPIAKAQTLAVSLIAPDQERYNSGQAQTASSNMNEDNNNSTSNMESTKKDKQTVEALGKTIKNCCSDMDKKNSA